MLKQFDQMMIDTYKKEAEQLGITLQEYLTYRILDQMNELKAEVWVQE